MSKDEKSGVPTTQLGYPEALSDEDPDSDAPTVIHPSPGTPVPDNRRADAHRQRLEELVRRASLAPASEPPPTLKHPSSASPRTSGERHRTSRPAAATASRDNSASHGSIAPTSAPLSSLSTHIVGFKLAVWVGVGVAVGGLAAMHLDRVLHPAQPVVECGSDKTAAPPAASTALGRAQRAPAVERTALSGDVSPVIEGAPTARAYPEVRSALASRVRSATQRDAIGEKPRSAAVDKVTAKHEPPKQLTPADDLARPNSPPLPSSQPMLPPLVLRTEGPKGSLSDRADSAEPTTPSWDDHFPTQACADPSRVQVPTQLHPRVNPLMTSGQVFEKP